MRLPTPAPVKRKYNCRRYGTEISPIATNQPRLSLGSTPEAQSPQAGRLPLRMIFFNLFSPMLSYYRSGSSVSAESILAKQTHAEVKRADSAGFIERSGMDTADINSMVNRAAMRRPELYEQMECYAKGRFGEVTTFLSDNPVGWVF